MIGVLSLGTSEGPVSSELGSRHTKEWSRPTKVGRRHTKVARRTVVVSRVSWHEGGLASHSVDCLRRGKGKGVRDTVTSK